MIDIPPEQVIEQRLVDCGLNPAGISVAYEDYLQSIEVVIKPDAGATKQHFDCINKAAGYEIVRFADMELAQQYDEFTTELFRPQILEDARKLLEKMGLLENFPIRAVFSSDELFAEAIEAHCGVTPGTALKSYDAALSLVLPQESLKDSGAFHEKYSCVFAAVMIASAKGDIKSFGFVGNDQLGVGEQK